jgi:hypothetical protein
MDGTPDRYAKTVGFFLLAISLLSSVFSHFLCILFTMTKADDKLGYLPGQCCLGSKCKAPDKPLRPQYRCALCDEMEESEEAQEEENALEGDDERECTMDTGEPAPTFLEALGHLDAFKRYRDANGVPRKVGESAVQLSRELQKHRLSIPTLNPTLFHYFPKK